MLPLPVNQIIHGDCFDILSQLPPNSVDLVVTSPPFWGLRDYGEISRIWGGNSVCLHEWGEDIVKKQSGGVGKTTVGNFSDDRIHYKNISNFCTICGAWRGQLGLEPHPQMFVDHLVEFGKLVKYVLKPTGLFWLNLGDTYFGGDLCKTDGRWIQSKQLLLMPTHVASGLQDDGWILRNDVIWFKPNRMPESINDRFTKSYEHFFMFCKDQHYYFNLDGVKIPYKQKNNEDREVRNKNPGDVWEIPTQPYPEMHYAVFPEKLVERIITCSTPKDGIVLDPFVGSGTSCVVAFNEGRDFIGIDLNRNYVNMAKDRLGRAGFREGGELNSWFDQHTTVA